MCLLRGIIEITGEVQYLFYSVSVQCEQHISDVNVEVTTCWRDKGVQSALFVIEKARSANV